MSVAPSVTSKNVEPCSNIMGMGIWLEENPLPYLFDFEPAASVETDVYWKLTPLEGVLLFKLKSTDVQADMPREPGIEFYVVIFGHFMLVIAYSKDRTDDMAFRCLFGVDAPPELLPN